MSKRATAVDVAKVAGVSQSAVSRAFTPGASVSAETRKRIQQAAEKLGYTPNAIARGLITQRSRMIGVVMAQITNPFYPEVLDLFTAKLRERGLQILLFNVPKSGSVEDLLPSILQYRVDGLVVASANFSSEMARLCDRSGIPVVLFNRYIQGRDLASVSCDNEYGAVELARLLAKHHRRIVYLAGIEDTSTNRDREHGFTSELARLGLSLFGRAVGKYNYDEAYNATKTLLDVPLRRRPDAIFAANDIMALAVLDAARVRFGMDVPKELSVVGFDDIPMANWGVYSLTTVRQPIDAMVSVTIALLENASSKHNAVAERLRGQLIIRDSAKVENFEGATLVRRRKSDPAQSV